MSVGELSSQESSLLTSLQLGNDERARRMLLEDSTLDLEQMDSQGRTPLMWASIRGYHDIVELLLLQGADVSSHGGGHGATALHVAADHSRVKIARTLLHCGASVDAQTQFGDTPAHLAAYRGHLSILKLFIRHGTDLSIKNKRRNTVMDEAIANNKWNILESLHYKEKKPEHLSGLTILCCNCRSNQLNRISSPPGHSDCHMNIPVTEPSPHL